jgi:hypothetical protein
VWYLLQVNVLAAAFVVAFVFAVSGVVVLSILIWREAKRFAAAQYRIFKRVASLLTQPPVFAKSIAISRTSQPDRWGLEKTRH